MRFVSRQSDQPFRVLVSQGGVVQSFTFAALNVPQEVMLWGDDWNETTPNPRLVRLNGFYLSVPGFGGELEITGPMTIELTEEGAYEVTEEPG